MIKMKRSGITTAHADCLRICIEFARVAQAFKEDNDTEFLSASLQRITPDLP